MVPGILLLVHGFWPIPDFSPAQDALTSEGIAIDLFLRPYVLAVGGTLTVAGSSLLVTHCIRRHSIAKQP